MTHTFRLSQHEGAREGRPEVDRVAGVALARGRSGRKVGELRVVRAQKQREQLLFIPIWPEEGPVWKHRHLVRVRRREKELGARRATRCFRSLCSDFIAWCC